MNALKTVIRYLIPFVIMPLTVWAGGALPFKNNYTVISCIIAILSLVLFYCSFDTKKLSSRRLVLCAVMSALCVIGRFIPFLKPVTAITVISSVYMGAESGFLIGSMSALVSNMYFGQGPWTPFQMLAWGTIGFLSGLLSSPLKKSRCVFIIYCAICGILYSLVMDVWTSVFYNGSLTPSLYISAVVTSLPHMALYTVSNVIFGIMLFSPLGRKFERIKLKYGI